MVVRFLCLSGLWVSEDLGLKAAVSSFFAASQTRLSARKQQDKLTVAES